MTALRTLLALALALLMPLWGGTALADEAMRARVLDLLSAFEDAPTAEDWARLGPGAAAELLAVAQDATLPPTRRGNALVALGHFPSEAHRAHLAAVLADPDAPVLLRRKAVAGLAIGWGEGALPALRVAATDADAHVRDAAAQAVARIEEARK